MKAKMRYFKIVGFWELKKE